MEIKKVRSLLTQILKTAKRYEKQGNEVVYIGLAPNLWADIQSEIPQSGSGNYMPLGFAVTRLYDYILLPHRMIPEDSFAIEVRHKFTRQRRKRK